MRRVSWGLAQGVFEQSGHLMREDNIQVVHKQDRVPLWFLYAKEVLASKPEVRKIEFRHLMDPMGAGLASKEYFQARERLRAIVPPQDDATGDLAMDHLPDGVQSFADFVHAHPAWDDPNAFICPEVKTNLVQRVQKSGLCYLQAPIVLQHYLVARSGTGPAPGMIDMAKFIRKHFTARELYERIFRDHGGSSVALLDFILQPDSLVVGTGISFLDQAQLERYGPHLLAEFNVHNDFMYNDHQLSFTGKPEGKTEGKHAMIIVGVRTKEDGSKIFLVQNWWPKMQFVEMDAAYMKACMGFPIYVKTEQTAIPTQFEATFDMYAETTLDKEETCRTGE